MNVYHVTLPQYGKTVEVHEEITLQQLLRAENIRLDAPCGGKGTCKKCRCTVNGKEQLACQTVIREDMIVILPNQKADRILTSGEGALWDPDGANRYAMAFDVGTTTVAGYLLDGRTGRVLATVSAPNPQREFGADVISRIQYALTVDASALQKTILNTLGELLIRSAGQAGISMEEITLVSLVGNTCMHHLLLGIDTRSLATPPYQANVTEALTYPAARFLPLGEDALLRVLPNISGFVGADTVGCLLATAMDGAEDWTLLVDIGTNGEMVLGKGSRRIACSTAAGPAFEGAKIECGMRGAEGAIDHVWLDGDEIKCSVIGGGAAVGLCGSGLLDAVAVLLKKGVIAPNGRMTPKRFILQDEVYLSQKDVRQVQLAKSAIRAGIELMAKTIGIKTAQIRRLLLAGAFGNHLSPESACAIGLLPPVLLDRVQSVGNAAGEGAKSAAVSATAFEKATALAQGTEFLELATLPEFQDTYISLLDFREVDLWND